MNSSPRALTTDKGGTLRLKLAHLASSVTPDSLRGTTNAIGYSRLRFCLCRALFWHQLNQTLQGLVDLLGVVEVFSHSRVEYDRSIFQSEMLYDCRSVGLVDYDAVPLAIRFVVLASNSTLHRLEIIFGAHVIGRWISPTRLLLHILSPHLFLPFATNDADAVPPLCVSHNHYPPVRRIADVDIALLHFRMVRIWECP